MRHPQDDLLLLEALVEYSQSDYVTPKRADRAWLLADELAASHGLALEDAVCQIEYSMCYTAAGSRETAGRD